MTSIIVPKLLANVELIGRYLMPLGMVFEKAFPGQQVHAKQTCFLA